MGGPSTQENPGLDCVFLTAKQGKITFSKVGKICLLSMLVYVIFLNTYTAFTLKLKLP